MYFYAGMVRLGWERKDWDCNKTRYVYLPPNQLHRQQLSSSGAALLAVHAESFYLVSWNHPS